MDFGYLFIAALLIFLVILGVIGMFFCKNHVKKICSLAISYSGFLFFLALISFRNYEKFNSIVAIMISLLIIFAGNLFIGIILARNAKNKV